MNILLDIGHPAHVHFFKNFACIMNSRGHKVIFTTRDKECTISLLEYYKFQYISIGKPYKGALKKIIGMLNFDYQIYKIAKRYKIDIFLSIGSMYAAQASYILKKPHIVFDDTEHSKFEHLLYGPFSKVILNPSCFLKDLGKNQFRYKGYHELAYLHPNYFKPDPIVLEMLGVSKNERYAIVRFVAWNAGHDISQVGLNHDFKIKLIQELEKKVKVFISSEQELPNDLKHYKMTIPPEQMHNALAFAQLYIGEGATMASECAMIGTPAIYVNTLDAGTLQEQENYELIYGFRNSEGVLDKMNEILETKNLKEIWCKKLFNMLGDKTDVTLFMTSLVEKYPESRATLQK